MFFDSTFKIDGGQTGIFNVMGDRYQDGKYSFDSKAVLDFFYCFIVLILLIEILGGLIIDTFAELRAENDLKENDMGHFIFDLKKQASAFFFKFKFCSKLTKIVLQLFSS